MDRLQLKREWVLGDRIGDPSGFGQVFAAESSDGESAALKLVPKAPGAEREMLFVDLAETRNVVPVIDSGETEDSWVIVMPRAERSLRDYLRERGPLLPPDAAAVLADVATTLVDLQGKVVHRDIKPENVLFLDGHWCLADFGISRYAEATTAADTRKFNHTPQYTAPERWRGERATSASDVYSLGVMAYEMLSGRWPFPGPEGHDFREGHLHSEAPALVSVGASLAALVEECLYKGADTRPSPANVLARLTRIAEAPLSPGLTRLQEANLAEARRLAELSRRESEARSEDERRELRWDAAKKGLLRISEAMREAVVGGAPSARVEVPRNGGWVARMGPVTFMFGSHVLTDKNPWNPAPRPAVNVVAHSKIDIHFPADQHQYEGRSHSLWFCDAQEAGRFQWYETAFMVGAFVPARGRQNPFSLPPCDDSAIALSGVMGSKWAVAWPFDPMNLGDLDEFVDRWAGWLADATQGRLAHPGSMPERPVAGSWRRS